MKGSPDRSVSIADLAGAGTIHGKGSGEVPEVPAGDTGGCVGRLGSETFAAPQLITQAAHVKVDRETGVVRVLKVAAAHDSGMILNRLGADGQVTGGVVMGVGLALSEGTQFDDDGRQRNPHLLDYKLVTCSDAPEIEVDWVQIPTENAGPRGSKGVGEPPQVPTAGAIANAIAKVLGRRVRQLPMTPERVWAASREVDVVTRSFASAATVEDALDALGVGCPTRRRRHGPRGRSAAGEGPAARGDRRDRSDRGARRHRRERRAVCASARSSTHDEIVASEVVRERFSALADASAIVGSHATRAHGTIGGNVMNASPAMDTGGPLLCFGATALLRSASGERAVHLDELWTGPGTTIADPQELLVGIEVPAWGPETGSAYVRLEYRRQMEIAIVGVTAAVRLDGGSVADARLAITALAPTIRRVPDAEAALTGSVGGRRCDRGSGPSRGRRLLADRRRSRIGRVPVGDGRGDRPSRDRDRALPCPRRAGGDPGERRHLRGGSDHVNVPATLRVNGTAYAVELDPHQSLLDAVRDVIGLIGSKEGCDDSECGACMMLLDGKPVNSCSYLALQADGRDVTTVEGLAEGDELAPLQRALLEHGGVQCGFCTPGMLISATALLRTNADPSEEDVRIALSGNLCRCTGYDGIVRAVRSAARPSS